MQGQIRGEDARLITAAARRFWRFVKKDHENQISCKSGLMDDEDWLLLCERYGIITAAIDCPPSFTAKLWYSEDHCLWFICYNWRLTRSELCKCIAHEFFEFLAQTDHDGLFDELPGVWAAPSASGKVYCYDGPTEPSIMHHRISQRGETICFRRIT